MRTNPTMPSTRARKKRRSTWAAIRRTCQVRRRTSGLASWGTGGSSHHRSSIVPHPVARRAASVRRGQRDASDADVRRTTDPDDAAVVHRSRMHSSPDPRGR